jgi:predicted Fe-Mo cluster-binding NifX family protein
VKEKPMKIAVATENGECISADFGRSPYFVVLEIEEGKILSRSIRWNRFTSYFRGRREYDRGRGHQNGRGDQDMCQCVAETLEDCNVIISHGLSKRACEDLRARGIEMIATDATRVEQAALKYLDGKLDDHTTE